MTCVCGMPLPPPGVAFVCECGRRYSEPVLDPVALITRIDKLERRIHDLETLIARRDKP